MSLENLQSNVDHVIHLMFENRGFDHLLGYLWNDKDKPRVHVPALRTKEKPFYGVPVDSAGNPTVWLPDDKSYYASGTYTGGKKFIHKGSWGYCNMPPADPGEGWEDVAKQIYGPGRQFDLPADKLMKGFYLNYLAAGKGIGSDDDILATYTPDQLPVLNTLARNFAVSDMWFCSAPTQTNPNRAFSLGGSSENRLNNLSLWGTPYTDLRTIFGVFNDCGVSWKIFAADKWKDRKYFTQYMFPKGMDKGSFGSIKDFKNQVAGNQLPAFSYIEPTFLGEAWFEFNSYHPPGSTHQGEKFLKLIYDTLKGNKTVWDKSLLIVTFDEHGGTYDHVPPPTNAVPPYEGDPPYRFDRFGVRVPTILISPWVPAGAVFRADYYPEGGLQSGYPYDHTSILATLAKWKHIQYQTPTDPGWLLARTAAAPTFENVITNTNNGVMPEVSPYDCSTLGFTAATETVGSSGVAVGRVTQIVARILSQPADSDSVRKTAAEIVANSETREDLELAFDKLSGRTSQ